MKTSRRPGTRNHPIHCRHVFSFMGKTMLNTYRTGCNLGWWVRAPERKETNCKQTLWIEIDWRIQ